MKKFAMKTILAWTVLLVCGFACQAQNQAQPLRVYILVGQSNMQGHAHVSTFDYIGEDPATAPLLEMMTDDNGAHTVSDRVWISHLVGAREGDGVLAGPLTTGFGARNRPDELGDKIGPEFTFGLTMEQAYDGPILIIKCAWGGRSLHTDFRPPGSGPYVPTDAFLQTLVGRAERNGETFDRDAWQAERDEATGVYYRQTIEHVRSVLANLDEVPGYDEDAGHELAGFVWFQGWNDMVDSNVYPNRDQEGGYDLYTRLLAQFIRDVRSDLEAPEMPFVIGVMGVGGENTDNQRYLNFRAAMAAPAAMPEFRGNTFAVPTAPYWPHELDAIAEANKQVINMQRMLRTEHRDGPNADGSMNGAAQRAYIENYRNELISGEDQARWERAVSNGDYHYLGCSKTMAQIGEAFAQALIELEQDE